MTATQAALKELELTGEYEGADMSVGLRAGWTFAVSDDNYQAIKSALVNAERVQGLVEALEPFALAAEQSKIVEQFNPVMKEATGLTNFASSIGCHDWLNAATQYAAFNAGRDEGEKK